MTTRLSASFYNGNGELQQIASDEILASVPAGATLFLVQKDTNGSPKTVTRRMSISGKPQKLDSSSSESLSSVPPSCVQATEEQTKILRHFEAQTRQFEQSLGGLATDPNWRMLLSKISRSVQNCVLRGATMSEQLEGFLTPEGRTVLTHIYRFDAHDVWDTKRACNETTRNGSLFLSFFFFFRKSAC